jgi:hypothetical protein
MKVIIFAFLLTFCLLFMYGAGCFYFITFDIAQWSEGGRFAFISFIPFALIISSVIFFS